MSSNPLTGKRKVSFKCSDELEVMVKAAARFEKRDMSDICRIALHEYFVNKGYYSPEILDQIAGYNEGETE